MNLSAENKKWLDEYWEKCAKKIAFMADEIGAIPINVESEEKKGYYTETKISDWTVSFWPGMLWHMYLETKDEKYRKIAEEIEDKMDDNFVNFDRLHHDVGFMWLLTSVANYRITGNEKSKIRALHAASTLASRYNPNGRYIRAWNTWGSTENITKAIIDCMMNIPILYWATDIDGDTRFRDIAMNHADKVKKHFIRPDGSVHHMIVFDPETHEPMKAPFGQGYAEGSSWTRGQAWAIYGFTMSYIKTGKKDYLEAAQKVIHYFMMAMGDRDIAPCDFRQPAEPDYRDAAANVIAACGMIELSKVVPEWDSQMYLDAAIRLVKGCEKYTNFNTDNNHLLDTCTGAYLEKSRHNCAYIWGDYYLVEAIEKLRGVGEGIFSF